jgi:positive phototaxis protein PixI
MINPSVDATNVATTTPGEPLLRVRLDRQNVAILPLHYLQEVAVVPLQRLTPIPNVHSCMLGLINRRSRVIWAIDLAQMLCLQSSTIKMRQYNIVIVQVGNKPLGLAVQNVESIVRLPPSRIKSPPATVSADLVPYLRGYVLEEEHPWLVLDVPAIANSPMLRSY